MFFAIHALGTEENFRFSTRGQFFVVLALGSPLIEVNICIRNSLANADKPKTLVLLLRQLHSCMGASQLGFHCLSVPPSKLAHSEVKRLHK